MGRPLLPLGTYGKVLCTVTPSGQVRARVKFRDYDGRIRLMSRTGASRTAAEGDPRPGRLTADARQDGRRAPPARADARLQLT